MRAPERGVTSTWVGLGALATVLALVGSCSGSEPDPDPPAGPTLERAVEEHLATQDIFDDVRAVLVWQGDELVLEQYRGTTGEEYCDTQSVTKSVMSTLVGIAIDEGHIAGVDARLDQLLPDYSAQMRPAVAATTLEQVLTGTAGFAGSVLDPSLDFTRAEDWTAAALRDARPSTASEFAYSDGGAHLLSAILEEATGSPVLEYAQSSLFDPLGIVTEPATQPLAVPRNVDRYLEADFAWAIDPQGRNTGWSALKLRPEDMLKIGLLHLRDGVWEGEQVVSTSWVREATRSHVEASGAGEGYGYMWWVGEADDAPAYRAWGYGGQLIEVVPEQDLVVVVCSGGTSEEQLSRLTPDVILYLADEVIARSLD
jgi:CubicO group peptidase (beta-lactamase class C family)